MKIRIVEMYKIYFTNNSFVNFLETKNITFDTFWCLGFTPASKFLGKSAIIFQEIKCFFKLLLYIQSFKNKKILSFGGHYSLFFITKLFGSLLGRDYHLFIYNFYLHSAGKKQIVKKVMRFLLSSKYTTLVVQSPDEVEDYTSLSQNPVHFIPFCEDPSFKAEYANIPDGDYLFTGGYTNRDYALILKCALFNPQIKFVLVVSRLNKELDRKNLPDNIIIFEEIGLATFNGLMNRSVGVIIPLKENVGSSGQMLCIGAMKMCKPIIYCDLSSINYYFENKNCGISYIMGDFNSLNAAILQLLSGGEDINLMGKRAYENFSENYTLDKRNEKLLNLIIKN